MSQTNQTKMRSTYYSRANSYSKSYNAIIAESEGRYSRTVAAKKLGLSIKAFDAGCAYINYRSTEWHHVGKYANAVDYYDTKDLGDNALFWKGATTRGNADYCKKQITEVLRAKLFPEQNTAAQVSVEPTWDGEYAVKCGIESDHNLRKAISVIYRRRKPYRSYQSNNNVSNREKKRLQNIFLNVNGTITHNGGKEIAYSKINWSEYEPYSYVHSAVDGIVGVRFKRVENA